MDIKKFESFTIPKQNRIEWRGFIEFVWDYFNSKGIKNPMVVELGVFRGEQRVFYEEILGATYIGIDNREEAGKETRADIYGNTHDAEVIESLKIMLNGRPINLLFIDACHKYEYVKKDYEIYGPMTDDLIAFHDIKARVHGVGKLWAELHAGQRGKLFVSFCNADENCHHRMGIGIEVRK